MPEAAVLEGGEVVEEFDLGKEKRRLEGAPLEGEQVEKGLVIPGQPS